MIERAAGFHCRAAVETSGGTFARQVYLGLRIRSNQDGETKGIESGVGTIRGNHQTGSRRVHDIADPTTAPANTIRPSQSPGGTNVNENFPA